MELSIKRVIIFTKGMPALTRFYRDVLGLRLKSTNPAGRSSTPADRHRAAQRHFGGGTQTSETRLLFRRGRENAGGPPQTRSQARQNQIEGRSGSLRGNRSRRQSLSDLQPSGHVELSGFAFRTCDHNYVTVEVAEPHLSMPGVRIEVRLLDDLRA